ncbi:MAG: hypothetical protein ACFFCS_26735 [Candidatus Hodarchaeota archaeon]
MFSSLVPFIFIFLHHEKYSSLRNVSSNPFMKWMMPSRGSPRWYAGFTLYPPSLPRRATSLNSRSNSFPSRKTFLSRGTFCTMHVHHVLSLYSTPKHDASPLNTFSSSFLITSGCPSTMMNASSSLRATDAKSVSTRDHPPSARKISRT